MTATMMPVDAISRADDGLRIPVISANLLPPEIVAARRTRKVRRTVLAAMLVVVVALAGWYGAAGLQVSAAQDDLEVAQAEVLRLQQQQKEYSDLITAQNQLRSIGSELSGLMADDLSWSSLLSSLRASAPAGVKITGVNGALNTAGAADSAESLPRTSTDQLIGTLTLNGEGPDNKAVARYVDALADVRGVERGLLTDATRQEGHITFSIRLDITSAALGGRYTPDGETESVDGS